MAPVPLACPPALPSELLSYVLGYQSFPTTLIICQPRSAFLSSLLSSINRPAETHALDAVTNTTEQHPANLVSETPKQHPLLVPTLKQVASSRYINLVFCNTVTHLRAYLSAFPAPQTERRDLKGKPESNRPEKCPLILVYGLLELHRDTSEWSVQGLGSSIAVLVEAGWRAGRRIVVLEEKMDVQQSPGDGGDRPQGIWEERLPMLSGNVKRAGFDGEDAVWSGRTVEVRRVLGRWFKFRGTGWSD